MNSAINLRHIGFVVKDLQKALDFYINTLGMTELSRATLSKYVAREWLKIDSNIFTIKLKCKKNYSTLLELYYIEDEEIRNNYRWDSQYNHMAIRVGNIKNTYEALKQSSYIKEFVSDIIEHGPKIKFFFARDISGNLMEFTSKLE